MRRLPAAAIPARLPEHRQPVDEDSGPVLSQHRGAESQPVQEDLGRDVFGAEQSLSQTATTESGLVSRDHGPLADRASRWLSPPYAHQFFVVRIAYGQRCRGLGQGLPRVA